jgi:hypothetical protein
VEMCLELRNGTLRKSCDWMLAGFGRGFSWWTKRSWEVWRMERLGRMRGLLIARHVVDEGCDRARRELVRSPCRAMRGRASMQRMLRGLQL